VNFLKRHWAATEGGGPAATGGQVDTPLETVVKDPAATDQLPAEEPPAEPGEKGDTVPQTWAEVFKHQRFVELNTQKNDYKALAEAVPQLRGQLEAMSKEFESLRSAAPPPPPELGLAEQMARDTVKQWMSDGMSEDEALDEWKSQAKTLLPIFRSMERQAKAQEEKMGKSLQPFQDKERVTRLSQLGAEIVKDPFYLSGGAKLDDNPLMGLLALSLKSSGVDLDKADLQTVMAEAGKLKGTFYKTVLPGLFVQAVADKDPASMAGLAQALKAAMAAEIPEVIAVLTEAAEAYDALKDKQDKKFPPLGKGKTPRVITPPEPLAVEPTERALQRATMAASGMGG
jgi:hypothetical protein